jgi:hypothetical protein
MEHAADSLRRTISFALPSRDFASLSAVCREISLLKTKHFTPRLSTSGSYVRIRTGEPLCFSNSTDTEERWQSTKWLYFNQMHGATNPTSAVRLFTNPFNSRKCRAADMLRAVMRDTLAGPQLRHVVLTRSQFARPHAVNDCRYCKERRESVRQSSLQSI